MIVANSLHTDGSKSLHAKEKCFKSKTFQTVELQLWTAGSLTSWSWPHHEQQLRSRAECMSLINGCWAATSRFHNLASWIWRIDRLQVSPLWFPANWYVNFSWTSVHTPTPPVSLYSCTPTSTRLPLPSEISGEVRTRSALVAALYSVTAAALISPAVSRLASGANITALYWSLLTPHELNMDKHTRQLTGRQWWGGGFAETSGNRFISSQLPIGDFQASREVAANASP